MAGIVGAAGKAGAGARLFWMFDRDLVILAAASASAPPTLGVAPVIAVAAPGKAGTDGAAGNWGAPGTAGGLVRLFWIFEEDLVIAADAPCAPGNAAAEAAPGAVATGSAALASWPPKAPSARAAPKTRLILDSMDLFPLDFLFEVLRFAADRSCVRPKVNKAKNPAERRAFHG